MIYQLHIRLLETKPPIWRRIQVSGKIKVYRLAILILRAMGWDNSHLCEFEIDGKKYGYKDPDGYDDGVLEFKSFVVSKVLTDKIKNFEFVYDFGDDWRHEIVVEDVFPEVVGVKYPLCVDGERACPPDDIGGVYGFYDYLEILADPSHEEYENMLSWSGEFNSEKFDKEEVTKRMQKK
jgi:hypothetical protein